MKKISFCFMTACLSLTFNLNELKAINNSPIIQSTVGSEEAQRTINRLEEIRVTDKSTFNIHKKKRLQKEVRSISESLKQSNPVIIISGGALLLIIVLLIILL